MSALDTLAPKLRTLMEAREARDETKLAAENAEKRYKAIEGELWEELEDSPLKGALKLDLGPPYGVVAFQPRETYYGRVLDEHAALDYFEQSARMDEFTAPKIVKARVNELVRQSLENGDKLPEGIDFYAARYVSVTRQKT